jgi:hypothetical protein
MKIPLTCIALCAVGILPQITATQVNIRNFNQTGLCLAVKPSAMFVRKCANQTTDPATAAQQLFNYDALSGKMEYGKAGSGQCLRVVVYEHQGGGLAEACGCYVIVADCATRKNDDDDSWSFEEKWSYDNTKGRLFCKTRNGKSAALDSQINDRDDPSAATESLIPVTAFPQDDLEKSPETGWQRQQRPWPLLLAGTNTKQLTLTPGPNRPGSSCHRAPL